MEFDSPFLSEKESSIQLKQKGPLIRFLSDVLYGMGVHDPIAFIGVPVFLLGIALLASYILARRAVRVDPVVALRYQ